MKTKEKCEDEYFEERLKKKIEKSAYSTLGVI